MSNKMLLKLYVIGQTSRSINAIKNVKRICEKELKGKYVLQIIDILENPQLAEDEKILATPTLVKELPAPLKRIIGDLSNLEKVLIGLDITSIEIIDNNEDGGDDNE